MFGEIAARCGRRAERSDTYSVRANRLKPNIVISKRGSYQRREHSTVCKVASYRLNLPRTRLTTRRTHQDRDAVVARPVVCVLGRDDVYGACKGVSESVPPDGGGALVAAAPLRTLSRAFVLLPQLFGGARRRQKSRVYQLVMLRMRFLLCTRPCFDELLLASHWHQSARRGITMHFGKSRPGNWRGLWRL
jgi:hypothetical protein